MVVGDGSNKAVLARSDQIRVNTCLKQICVITFLKQICVITFLKHRKNCECCPVSLLSGHKSSLFEIVKIVKICKKKM